MSSLKPLVYIIIVNWNGYKHTAECLNSLKKLKYENFKIVVIDNGSKNNEPKKLRKKFPFIFLIRNKSNRGYAKANNQGIKLALKRKSKYILLLNNDTVVKPDFLNMLVNYAESNNFQGVLTPKILYYNSSLIWAMGGKLPFYTSIPQMIGQGKPSFSYKNILEPDYASGCAFFVNATVVKKVGLLDPIYFAYYEDTDLSFRIKKAGYKIKVIPKSIIWHKVSQSTKQKKKNKIGITQSYLLARNGLIFGTRNMFGPKKIIYLLSQYLFKFPLYLLFKVENFRSAKAYSCGMIDQIKYILEPEKNKKPSEKFIN